jgi:hypothetical protein
VVATVTVTFAGELLKLSDAGETAQRVSEGAPEQVKVVFWLNPPTATMLNA